jgi:hypothetical protein
VLQRRRLILDALAGITAAGGKAIAVQANVANKAESERLFRDLPFIAGEGNAP